MIEEITIGSMGQTGGINHERVYLELAEELEGAILRGEYRPGARLPSERQLAARHGVNRHTAGQALSHLQSKGLVSRVMGRGTFVSPGRVAYWITRTKTFSEEMSREGLETSRRVVAVRRVRALRQAAERLLVPQGEPLVALERVYYLGEIPLDYGTKYLPEALFPGLHDSLRTETGSLRALVFLRYGVCMNRVRSVFEIEPADGDAARYLGVHSGFPLLKVESLNALEDGTPAEWGISYYRGDAAKLGVEVGPAKEGGHGA